MGVIVSVVFINGLLAGRGPLVFWTTPEGSGPGTGLPSQLLALRDAEEGAKDE